MDFPDLTDYDLEQQRLKRQRLLAQQLLSAPEPEGSMVSGHFVPAGYGRYTARALDHMRGNQLNAEIDQQERQLARREAEETAKFLGDIPTSTPATPSQLAPGLRLPTLRQTIAQQLGQTLDYPQQNQQAQAKAQEAQTLAQLKEEERRQTKEEERQFRAEQAQAQRDFQAGQNQLYRRTADQLAHASPGSPGKAPGAASESERGAAGYLGRMQAAEALLEQIGPAGDQTLRQAITEAIPSVGDYAQRVTGSDPQNMTVQAQRDWVRAKLRKESGAVIGEQEMADEIRTYFPRAGDSDALKAQKRQSRLQAQEQMRSSAGRVDPTRAPQAVPPQTPARVRVSTREEWQALPPGTPYTLPDGRTGVR
jgi:hypothetical protein